MEQGEGEGGSGDAAVAHAQGPQQGGESLLVEARHAAHHQDEVLLAEIQGPEADLAGAAGVDHAPAVAAQTQVAVQQLGMALVHVGQIGAEGVAPLMVPSERDVSAL